VYCLGPYTHRSISHIRTGADLTVPHTQAMAQPLPQPDEAVRGLMDQQPALQYLAALMVANNSVQMYSVTQQKSYL
jgi:hypothetical protein